jgi:transposase-like protein
MPASIRGRVHDHPVKVAMRSKTTLLCPSCGSLHVVQVLGDNGGISYVCTACGHSWS